MKVVEEIGQLQQTQKNNKIQQKDIVSIATMVGGDLPPQTKVEEWQAKTQELGDQLENLMKQQE